MHIQCIFCASSCALIKYRFPHSPPSSHHQSGFQGTTSCLMTVINTMTPFTGAFSLTCGKRQSILAEWNNLSGVCSILITPPPPHSITLIHTYTHPNCWLLMPHPSCLHQPLILQTVTTPSPLNVPRNHFLQPPTWLEQAR